MKKWMSFVVLVLSSVAAAGCGDEPIPEQGFVSYAVHIQPILTARCVRCHGGGGTLNGDPDAFGKGIPKGGKPINGYFECGSEDRGDCSTGSMSCKHGLRYYATNAMGMAALKIWLPSMPPKPSPPLTDREQELLARWFAKPDISPCPTP